MESLSQGKITNVFSHYFVGGTYKEKELFLTISSKTRHNKLPPIDLFYSYRDLIRHHGWGRSGG